jgi:hypothetical protein
MKLHLFKISKDKLNLTISIVLSIVILMIIGAVIYLQYNASKILDLNATERQKTNEMIDKISSLIYLPQGETPTYAIIANIDKLQGQSFFRQAQNGDVVLVYNQAKKAFLYRPTINKIIEVGPVSTKSGEVE